MINNKSISIVIPTYEMKGLGAEILQYAFFSILIQKYKNYDVVVSDDSTDDAIEKLCLKWSDKFELHYYRNEMERGGSSNLNNAIAKADKDFIKILLQDDLLSDENSLQVIADNLDENTKWLFTAYMHTKDRREFYRKHLPSLNPDIAIVNTLGTPSALTLRNGIELPLFDTNLQYCYDEDFYYQMLQRYGEPKIIDRVTMYNFIWDGSVTSGVTNELVQRENEYIMQKHNLRKAKTIWDQVTIFN